VRNAEWKRRQKMVGARRKGVDRFVLLLVLFPASRRRMRNRTS
jgi:hypothetical protein